MRHRFVLYVAGETERSARAMEALEALCEQELGGDYELFTLDVLRRPDQALAAGVATTPAVVREQPAPVVVWSGDWSDLAALRRALVAP